MPGVTTAYQSGIHASRPSFSSGCILYACSTHNKVYRSDGTAWADWLSIAASGMTNPMTTAGDIIYSSDGSGTPARLGIGSNGDVLTLAAGIPSWAAPSAGSTFSGAKAYATATQSMSNGSIFTFDAEDSDSASYHSTVTNTGRLTVPTTGQYAFCGGTFLAASSGGGPLYFRTNGATNIRGSATTLPSAAGYVTTVGSAQLTAGDYIELLYGGTNTVICGHAAALDAQSWAAIWRVG